MNGQKGNTMYKYYLFDLDGTISQSEPGILNCIRYALDAAGLQKKQKLKNKKTKKQKTNTQTCSEVQSTIQCDRSI